MVLPDFLAHFMLSSGLVFSIHFILSSVGSLGQGYRISSRQMTRRQLKNLVVMHLNSSQTSLPQYVNFQNWKLLVQQLPQVCKICEVLGQNDKRVFILIPSCQKTIRTYRCVVLHIAFFCSNSFSWCTKPSTIHGRRGNDGHTQSGWD